MTKIIALSVLGISITMTLCAQGTGVLPDPPPPYQSTLVTNFSSSSSQTAPAGGGSVPGSDTRPEGTYNPQTPPGGDGSQNAQNRHSQTPEEIAQGKRNYATLLASAKQGAAKYASNVADFYTKLSEQPVIRQSARYPRIAKYINACKSEIDDINANNKAIQDITTLDYNNFASTKESLLKADADYQEMMRNVQRAKVVENLANNKPAIINGLINNANNRDKIIDHQITELNSQRRDLVSAKASNNALGVMGILGLTAEMSGKSVFNLLGLLVDNVEKSELNVLNLQFEVEGVKLLNAGLAYSLKATDEFVEHWVAEGKDIDLAFLDEMNNRAVFAAGLSYVDEAYFIEKTYDTYDALTKKWGELNEDNDLLQNQADETIRQIDFSIRQLKKMKQVNKAAPAEINMQLENYLVTDVAYPELRHFEFIPATDQSVDLSKEFAGVAMSLQQANLYLSPCSGIDKFKTDANTMTGVSVRYLNQLEHADIFPGAGVPASIKSFYTIAKQGFNYVKDANANIQPHDYVGQNYSTGCNVSIAVLVDQNNLFSTYNKSIDNINKLRLAQKIYVDSGGLVQRLQTLVNARDTLYNQLINASRRLSGSISVQTSKPTIPANKIKTATAKTILQIKKYLNYSGTDMYTVLFKQYADSIIQKPESSDIVNSSFVSDFVKNSIALNRDYNIRLWMNIFSQMERSSMTKIKAPLHAISSKNKVDDLAAYYQSFLMAKAAHKNIFSTLNTGIQQAFH